MGNVEIDTKNFPKILKSGTILGFTNYLWRTFFKK